MEISKLDNFILGLKLVVYLFSWFHPLPVIYWEMIIMDLALKSWQIYVKLLV